VSSYAQFYTATLRAGGLSAATTLTAGASIGWSTMTEIRPIALSDSELRAVLAAARPIPPDRRDAFLRELASTLQNSELGPGALHRAIVTVQRKYFDPPDL